MPVLFSQEHKGGSMTRQAYFNIHQAVGVAYWALEHKKRVEYSSFKKPFVHPSHFSRVLMTNGHMWRLLEMHSKHVKKSKFLTPHSLNGPFARTVYKDQPILFFEDYTHMKGVIGLIRFAL